MRGHVFHHFALLVKRPNVLPVKSQDGVNHVRSNGVILSRPAEEFGVELLSPRAVGGGQLGPAKSARRELELCLCSCFAHLSFLLYRMNTFSGGLRLPAIKSWRAVGRR